MQFHKVNEIFDLCRRVILETGHFVKFSVAGFEKREFFVIVDIKENGWQKDGKFDATYSFICNRKNDLCKEMYEEEYENCKQHLNRLLGGVNE